MYFEDIICNHSTFSFVFAEASEERLYFSQNIFASEHIFPKQERSAILLPNKAPSGPRSHLASAEEVRHESVGPRLPGRARPGVAAPPVLASTHPAALRWQLPLSKFGYPQLPRGSFQRKVTCILSFYDPPLHFFRMWHVSSGHILLLTVVAFQKTSSSGCLDEWE